MIHRPATIVLFSIIAIGPILAGCDSMDRPAAESDLQSVQSPDALYPMGVKRGELHRRGGSGLIFVLEAEPIDTFAAATIRQMISLARPRPRSFERYTLPSPAGGRIVDYVFFDSHECVLYAARLTEKR